MDYIRRKSVNRINWLKYNELKDGHHAIELIRFRSKRYEGALQSIDAKFMQTFRKSLKAFETYDMKYVLYMLCFTTGNSR